MAHFNDEVSLSLAVGKYLKRELKHRHITQQTFSEICYVDVRTVSRWVNGGANSFAVLVSIANGLGVSVRDIFANLDEDVPDLLLQNIKLRLKYDTMCRRQTTDFYVSYLIKIMSDIRKRNHS